MTTFRDVTIALVLIAAALALDLVFPRWMAVTAGIAAYVACLVYFARDVRPRSLPSPPLAGDDRHAG